MTTDWSTPILIIEVFVLIILAFGTGLAVGLKIGKQQRSKTAQLEPKLKTAQMDQPVRKHKGFRPESEKKEESKKTYTIN